MATQVSTSPLAALRANPNARFIGWASALLLLNAIAVYVVVDLLAERAQSDARRMADAERLSRIMQQGWWVEEDKKLARVAGTVSARFWSGRTIGLVRADLESFLQGLLTKYKVRNGNALIETRTSSQDGIDQLKAQVRMTIATADLLELMSEIAAAKKDINVTRASVRFLKNHVVAEFGVSVPVKVEDKAVDDGAAAKPKQATKSTQ